MRVRNLIFCAVLVIWPCLSIATEVVDFLGNAVAAKNYQRIVTLLPSLGESVEGLGKAQQLVGVVEHTKLKDNKWNPFKLGSYVSLSIEQIYKLKPDLVLVSTDGNDPSLVTRLKKLKLNVFVVQLRTLAEILKVHEALATLLAVSESSDVRNQLQLLRRAVSSPLPPSLAKKLEGRAKVFFQIAREPLLTIGRNTFVFEFLTLVGLEPIFSEGAQDYPRPQLEEVLKRNPDFIFISEMDLPSASLPLVHKQLFSFWNRFEALKAVRNNQIKILSSDEFLKPGWNLIMARTSLESYLQEKLGR